MVLVKRKVVELVPPPDPQALAAAAAAEEIQGEEGEEATGSAVVADAAVGASSSKSGAATATAAAAKSKKGAAAKQRAVSGDGDAKRTSESPAADGHAAKLPDPEVFYLAKTGEIFLDYESYAARLAFYSQKIFQCELTGKIGLSYWEAVDSERHEALDLHHRFPEALKAPVLRSVQFVVTGRLDILVDLAFERFKDRFWPDENVLVEVQGDRYHARIKDAFPSRSLIRKHQQRVAEGKSIYEMVADVEPPPPLVKKGKGKAAAAASKAAQPQPPASPETSLNGSPKKNLPAVSNTEIMHVIGIDLNIDAQIAAHVDEPDEYLYTLQLVDNEGKFTGSLMEVRAKSLSRDRLAFSKTILKKYLRTCLVRDVKIGAPWIVRHIIAHRYSIPTHPSDEVIRKNNEIKDQKLSKRRKAVEEPPPPKVRRKKQKTEAQIEEEEEKAWQAAEEERRADKRKTVKFPWEDMDLGPITNRELLSRTLEEEVARRKDRPKPTRDVGMPGNTFEQLVGAYHFLNSCGKPLKLSNFALDDFEAALRHSTYDPFPSLIIEAHATVINVILLDKNPGLAAPSTSAPTRATTRSATSSSKATKQAVNATVAAAIVQANGAAGSSRANSEEVDELDSREITPMDESVDGPMENGTHDSADTYERTPEYLTVVEAARKVSTGWRDRYLTYERSRSGWDVAVVGALLELGDRAVIPRLIAILSQLTGVEHPDALRPPVQDKLKKAAKAETDADGDASMADKEEEETIPFTAHTYSSPLERYPTLPFEDKLAILNFLAEQATMTKAVRSYYDECEAQLTELRKERAEISKKRREIHEQRAELEGAHKDKENADDSKEKNGEEDEEGEGQEAEVDEIEDSEEEEDSDEEDDEDGDGGAKRRGARQSRQEALRQKAEKQKAAEAARVREQVAARAAQKARSAESKQLSNERKRLDEESAKLDTREDACEMEFRRVTLVPRLIPLGRDRFYEKYYWLDGIGTTPMINSQGQPQYFVGRLFVQGCSEAERIDMEDVCEEPRRWKDVQKRIPEEYGGEEGMLERNQWAVYSDPDEIEQLIAWLRVKGIRESALKAALVRYRTFLAGGMAKRKADLERGSTEVHAEKETSTRRSGRPKADGAASSKLAYLRYHNAEARS